MPQPKEQHYIFVSEAISYGSVIPFLGAGVNHAGRPEKTWEYGKQFLPDGSELARYLAENYKFPGEPKTDLARVSQYIGMIGGEDVLRRKLRAMFNRNFTPTPVHRFFAELPGILRGKGCSQCHQLIVTTNYDDLMERALADAHEEFDVISYVGDLARDDHQGRFVHWPFQGDPVLIDQPNAYKLPIDEETWIPQRTMVLKFHGAVDRRPNPQWDSYVITEDDYITFMALTDNTNWAPATLVALMKRSRFLFLGYGLRDWNLRVILHRIWSTRSKHKDSSWAVQFGVDDLEEELWARRNVELLDIDLDLYIAELRKRVAALEAVTPPKGND